MKQTRTLLNSFMACGVVLAMASTVFAQTANEGTVTVVRMKGSARYTTGNNVWQPLKVGQQLRPGTVIQTGLDQGSFVDLALGGANEPVMVAPSGSNARFMGGAAAAYQPASAQNAIHVYENSLVGIDKLTSLDTGADKITETQLDLKQGRMLGNVKKLSAASKYEIKLPSGVAGVRGTVYDVSADGVVQVGTGSVVVAWTAPDGATKTQVVMGGEQFDIRTGQITRLSPDATRSMDYNVAQLRGAGAPAAGAATYLADHTVYYVQPNTFPVSPTAGTTP